jgi:hypothetical protein
MKNLKSILAMVILTITFSLNLNAQWTFNPSAGIQINDTKVNGAGNFINGIPQSMIGLYVNLGSDYWISESLALSTGIGYNQKGFGLREGFDLNLFGLDIPLGVKANTKLHYMSVPLMGKVKLGNTNTRFIITGGAEVGYAVSAEIQPKATLLIDFNLPKQKINLDNNIYNRWDVSAKAGIGIEQQLGQGALSFNAAYMHSLTNVLDNPIIDVRIKPYSLQLGFGYTYNF